jgi:hypothetical protein
MMNTLDVLFVVVGVVLLAVVVFVVVSRHVKAQRAKQAAWELVEASKDTVGRLWRDQGLYAEWVAARGREARKVVLGQAAAGFLGMRPEAVDELQVLVEKKFMLDFMIALNPHSRYGDFAVKPDKSFERMFKSERDRYASQVAETKRMEKLAEKARVKAAEEKRQAKAVWAGLSAEEKAAVKSTRGRKARAERLQELSSSSSDTDMAVFLSAVALYASVEPSTSSYGSSHSSSDGGSYSGHSSSYDGGGSYSSDSSSSSSDSGGSFDGGSF